MKNKRKTPNNSVLRGIWRSANLKWRGIFILLGLLSALNLAVFGLSCWYAWTLRDQPTVIGATFIPRYANHFGIDPKETLTAITEDLGIKHLRLVSYWRDYEPKPGQYDFKELDWQFEVAQRAGAKISLAIGLRQPRWPECHLPSWAEDKPIEFWEPRLMQYITVVMERYRDHPALESYQLENEFFLKAFGDCPDHSRDRLVAEYDLAKRLDGKHPIIVSRSNNALGWPINAPVPDMYGVSVYKRVWDKTITKRYFEYPFPAQFYGFLGAMSKISQGKELIVHELQSEAWGPQDITQMTLQEQNFTMDAEKLKERIDYGLQTGLKRIDLWGPEYWYWRMVNAGDASLWNAAKEKLTRRNMVTCGVVLSERCVESSE